MNSKILKSILFSFAIVSIIACNEKKDDTQDAVVDKEAIKKEIQAKEDLFAETYNAGEKKSIGYYADDAISFSQNRRPLVGKQAIIDYLLEGLDSTAVSNKISFTTIEVFPSSDGVQVVEIGQYQVFDSSDSIVNSGNYMSLFEKRDGHYVSLRDMSTSDIQIE